MPDRKINPGPGVVVAPADGKVVAIDNDRFAFLNAKENIEKNNCYNSKYHLMR